MKKNIQGFINNVSKKKLAQDFTISTLCVNVYKMYECDKNQMLYCNVKSFKKPNFWEFWAIDRTWPTLDLFSFSEVKTIDTLEAYIQFVAKLFHLT
jgi:hypothetical protein